MMHKLCRQQYVLPTFSSRRFRQFDVQIIGYFVHVLATSMNFEGIAVSHSWNPGSVPIPDYTLRANYHLTVVGCFHFGYQCC